tara:strand:- start:9334 stop:10359 length:1026 start_codon:yes stop_codon:yes gene_type:complete
MLTHYLILQINNTHKQFTTMSNISTIIKPLTHDLALMENRLREPFQDQHEILTLATEHLLSSGGKRLRPAIALLSSKIFNANKDYAISLAAAVEMLHTATLVHDDLIDGALLRRGIKTLNADLSSQATILAGDYLFARAASFASQTNSVRVMNLFSETLMTIVNGEIKQCFSDTNISNRENYFQRIEAKTASMFALAAEAGAVLGTKDESLINAMRKYGINIGIAFQIVDDILDFTGAPQNIGKPVGHDLQQGLITLPVICYFEENPNDPDLNSVLTENVESSEIYASIIQSVCKSNAIKTSLSEASQYIEQAKLALSNVPLSNELSIINDIADYVVKRQI